MHQIRIAGLGGQGIILMGVILGQAAVYEKRFASLSSIYGPEVRGSSCRAELIIADERIDYPYITEADILIAMSQEGYDQFSKEVKEGGLIIYDSSIVKPDPSMKARHYLISATRMAVEKFENLMVANMFLLGALIGTIPLVTKDSMEKAILADISEKHSSTNKKALQLGLDYVGKKSNG